MRRWSVALGGTGALVALYTLLVRGDLTLDVGVGRRMRDLGPMAEEINAPREVVFDVITAPYLSRTPHALESKLRVIERGENMVLAAHYTTVRGGLTATTLETVRFSRPNRVDFRLVHGPVPHVVEAFMLLETDSVTTLAYAGELGTDFWSAGQAWGDRVAGAWEAAVKASLASIRAEAERRVESGRETGGTSKGR